MIPVDDYMVAHSWWFDCLCASVGSPTNGSAEGLSAANLVRYLDPSWGFAMGWNYCFGAAITVCAEVSAALLLIEYWTDNVRYFCAHVTNAS
jgi:amino acid permease